MVLQGVSEVLLESVEYLVFQNVSESFGRGPIF